jgi:hypothetical protein
VIVAHLDDAVGAERGERVQPLEVAAGPDYVSGTEPFCHLNGHRSGVAGGAEDEDALAGLDRNPATQGHPGRHRRIHRGGDCRDIDVIGQLDRPPGRDHRLVGHRPGVVVVGYEVDSLAVRALGDCVDAGDHRQNGGARVVGPGGAAAHARVQTDSENVDDDLLAGGRLRDLDLLVLGSVLE